MSLKFDNCIGKLDETANLARELNNENIRFKTCRNGYNFPFAPRNPTFSPFSCRAKVENSKLGCPRARSRFPWGRTTGMAFPDERNVFTAAQGGRQSQKWRRISAASLTFLMEILPCRRFARYCVTYIGNACRATCRPWERCRMYHDVGVDHLIARITRSSSKMRVSIWESSRWCSLLFDAP